MAEPLPHDLPPPSDQQLLEQFSRTRDAEAFRELVVRHSPLVLATCRRGLHSAADADDAFQATFLVLARSATKIRHRPAVGAWLYGVATRVCLRMRRDSARRNTQELFDTASEAMDPLDELLARHDEMVVDEELRRLPSSLRDPIVLRYLGNQSNTEVARQLGLSIAALEGRLKRGKQQLRMRLIRRGVTLVAVVATLKATRVAASEVPLGLVDSAVTLGTTTAAAASATATTTTTSSTSQIAFQELHAMNTLFALKPASLALSACGIAAAVMVASQVGMTPFASAQSGGGTSIELAVNEEGAPGEAADSAAVAVDVPGAKKDATTSDPFGGETGPAAGFGTEGYGGEEGAPGGMTSQFGGGGYGTGIVPGGAVRPSPQSPLPHVVDLKSRSGAEIRIESALKSALTNIGLNFTENTLSEVAVFLRDEYEMEVQIDTQALDDMGMSPDDTITITLRNIRLDSALDLMLREHDLTYIIHNEVLLITTETRASTMLEARAYPTDINSNEGADKLVEVIQTTVAPNTWSEVGGEGAIALIGSRLVIRQTYAVHREINELLSQLRDNSQQKTGSPAAPRGMQKY